MKWEQIRMILDIECWFRVQDHDPEPPTPNPQPPSSHAISFQIPVICDNLVMLFLSSIQALSPPSPLSPLMAILPSSPFQYSGKLKWSQFERPLQSCLLFHSRTPSRKFCFVRNECGIAECGITQHGTAPLIIVTLFETRLFSLSSQNYAAPLEFRFVLFYSHTQFLKQFYCCSHCQKSPSEKPFRIQFRTLSSESNG